MAKDYHENRTFFDSIKDKLNDVAKDFIDSQFKYMKKQIAKHIEKNIEQKIKKQIRAAILKSVAFTLIILGLLFLIYGFIFLGTNIMSMPQFMVPILFGTLILVVGIVVSIIR